MACPTFDRIINDTSNFTHHKVLLGKNYEGTSKQGDRPHQKCSRQRGHVGTDRKGDNCV